MTPNSASKERDNSDISRQLISAAKFKNPHQWKEVLPVIEIFIMKTVSTLKKCFLKKIGFRFPFLKKNKKQKTFLKKKVLKRLSGSSASPLEFRVFHGNYKTAVMENW